VVDFAAVRDLLRKINDAVGDGHLVSCSLRGGKLSVCIGVVDLKDDRWQRPWCMTFNDDDDYTRNPEGLIDELVRSARAWFSAAA
jgi:hypothetical protein